MTSSRVQIGPENVLAANIDTDTVPDNNADGDNVDVDTTTSATSANHPQYSCPASKPSELDELQSYELLYKKMMNLLKEVLLMFLVCIVYTVLTHDPPKTTKSPAAYPFFAKNSVVSDWYRGEVSSAVDIAGDADIGFVMFYAPWDAESQEVRDEFERAAQFLKGQIEFSAVNCWQPGSECKRKYSKVFKWPVLLAYTSDGKAIPYNGAKTALHMIRFLNNIMNPYKRVNSLEEIMKMMVEHDAVVLATVDCRPKSKSFTAAYNTALKLLEKDPLREIGFAITATSQEEAPSLQLYLWNETLIYPSDDAFKTRAITSWLTTHMHQVTMWLAPSGMKSQQLATYLQGPTLIMFTPQNPLLNQMDHYIALKQVALEYFTCNDTLPTPSVQEIHAHRQQLRKTFASKLSSCKFRHRQQQQPTISYTPSAFFYTNDSSPCNANEQCAAKNARLPTQCLRTECQIQPTLSKSKTTKFPTCHQDSNFNAYMTSLHSIEFDRFTTRNLLKLQEQWECDLLQLVKECAPVYFSNQDPHNTLEGLACQSNVSLTMFAMDSLLYHQFAESLGVDVLNLKRKTALVIVNPQDEEHFVYEGPLSDSSLREFVRNFTANNVPRALVDSASSFPHTHRYNLQAEQVQVCPVEDVCIRELTSKNFMATIMNPTKVVVVLYYSLQCAFCSGVSYIYLEAARVLANVSSIEFVRIDGDRNTLPWEYTIDKYPSILLFPVLYKSESRVFPEAMPMTLSNILSYILANLESSIKLQAMWEVCNFSKFEDDRSQCVSLVRRENLAHIEDTLREWRKAEPRHRQRILRKLQLLKTIHMNLAIESSALKHSQRVRNEFDKLSRSSLRSVLIKFIGGQFKSWRDDL